MLDSINHHCIRGTTALISVCFLLATTTAGAAVVVTQVEDRAFFSLWLLSQHIQQDIAHNLIIDNHEIVVVPEFTADTLAGADVVYVSPAYDELQITQPEIEALEQFVIDGGRLIIPGDYGMWVAELVPIAEHFGVIYGDSFINGLQMATITNFDNPITNGPNGIINSIQGSAINNSFTSSEKEFEVLATWSAGPDAIGFMQLGDGEAIFLTDFSTFDSDLINTFDNRNFWLNLFEYNACPADIDSNGSVGTSDLLILLSVWGSDPGGPPDFDGDGTVGTSDLLELLANWGPCS